MEKTHEEEEDKKRNTNCNQNNLAKSRQKKKTANTKKLLCMSWNIWLKYMASLTNRPQQKTRREFQL